MLVPRTPTLLAAETRPSTPMPLVVALELPFWPITPKPPRLVGPLARLLFPPKTPADPDPAPAVRLKMPTPPLAWLFTKKAVVAAEPDRVIWVVEAVVLFRSTCRTV